MIFFISLYQFFFFCILSIYQYPWNVCIRIKSVWLQSYSARNLSCSSLHSIPRFV